MPDLVILVVAPSLTVPANRSAQLTSLSMGTASLPSEITSVAVIVRLTRQVHLLCLGGLTFIRITTAR